MQGTPASIFNPWDGGIPIYAKKGDQAQADSEEDNMDDSLYDNEYQYQLDNQDVLPVGLMIPERVEDEDEVIDLTQD